MNERIKQLAEQANIHFSRVGILDGDPNGSARMVGYSKMEKFAELIVRECMDIARKVGNISEPDDWALDRCYEIEQRIQDHFGVEK